MIDSVAVGILLEIVFGGRVSCRFRCSLDLDVRHQNSKRIGIVLREMLAQDATDGFRHVVECLSLHLRPNVRNEGGHIEFGIDALNLFTDDQAVLCQIEKRALLSHFQYVFSFSETGDFRSCENDNISDCTDVNY